MLCTQRWRNLVQILPTNLNFVTNAIIPDQSHHQQLNNPLLDLCKTPEHLQQIHARFVIDGLHRSPALSCELIDSYANWGYLNSCRKVFKSVISPDITLCNRLLGNLYKFGVYKKALLVFQEMVLRSIYPDECTYPFVLRSCYEISDVKSGELIHGHVVKLGFDSFDSVNNEVVEMYRKSGSFCCKQQSNLEKPVHDVSVWSSLIFETFRNGDFEGCFRIFGKMRMERVEPDSFTVINLLRACVELNYLKLGRMIHGLALVRNLCEDLVVNTALLTMYSKMGSLLYARMLFDIMPQRDTVVWNLMISAYSRGGYSAQSLKLLKQMVGSGIRADLFTALAAISSIAELKSLKLGKEIHANVIRNGSDYQVSVINSLIDMYCESGCLLSAQKIFDLVENKTVASWSSMIKGYVSHEQFYDAVSLFNKMRVEGFSVDSITVINLLPACVNIGALQQIKYLHGYAAKSAFTSKPAVRTALLASYAKCGCIEFARKLFDDEETDSKDIIAWNSMISAFSKHGHLAQCFDLYSKMKNKNVKPDKLTFLGLLTACVNSGSVEDGWVCFRDMTEKYGFQPNPEHYACMVDLLGRAGHIKQASEMIASMPFKPDAKVWGPLLSACKIHSDTILGEFAAQRLIEMEPKNAGNYILLSNIYAASGKWDGVSKMRIFLRDKGLKKIPGWSWLEINGHVHEFRVADKSHPQADAIYAILENIELEINSCRKLWKTTLFSSLY